MAQYWEDWSGSTIGAAPTGWFTLWGNVGATYIVEADSNGPAGRRMKLTGSTVARRFLAMAAASADPDRSTFQVRILCRVIDRSGGYTQIGAAGRGSGGKGTENQILGVLSRSSYSNQVGVLEYKAGAGSSSYKFVTWDLNTDYWVTLTVSGDSAVMSFATRADPETAIGTATKVSGVTGIGELGIANHDDASVVHVYAVGIGTGGDPAPLALPVIVTPVSFAGTVTNKTGIESQSFSLDLKPFFSGNGTPFVYSLQSGALTGTGLALANGVISGTLPTARTISSLSVRATDSSSNVATTNTFSITVSSAVSIPNAPSAVVATAVTHNSATIGWTDNSTDETGFAVELSPSPYTTWTPAGTVAAGVTTLPVTGLSPVTSYKARVKALGATGDSVFVVSASSFTTVATPVIKGVRVQLFNEQAPQASVTGITFLWWDAAAPAATAPKFWTATAATDGAAWLQVNINAATSLAVGGSGFALAYKAGATPQDDLTFAGRLSVVDLT